MKNAIFKMRKALFLFLMFFSSQTLSCNIASSRLAILGTLISIQTPQNLHLTKKQITTLDKQDVYLTPEQMDYIFKQTQDAYEEQNLFIYLQSLNIYLGNNNQDKHLTDKEILEILCSDKLQADNVDWILHNNTQDYIFWNFTLQKPVHPNNPNQPLSAGLYFWASKSINDYLNNTIRPHFKSKEFTFDAIFGQYNQPYFYKELIPTAPPAPECYYEYEQVIPTAPPAPEYHYEYYTNLPPPAVMVPTKEIPPLPLAVMTTPEKQLPEIYKPVKQSRLSKIASRIRSFFASIYA